jgi:hypothetical protein
MTPQHSRRIGLWLVASLLVGCTTVGGPSSPATTVSPSTPSPTTSPTAPSSTPTPSTATTPASTGDGPPAALLGAEGGDPVVGQVGSHTWRDTGSDSPWLPGAPIAVATGEPLSVTIDPITPVAAWRARSVPSGADGPEGATLLGEGAGTPTFTAPARGSWTVEVRVTYADGVGDASYYWALEVS